MRNILVVQRRWRDVQVDDIIRDPSWAWPRWCQVSKIEHNLDSTEAWFGAEHDKKGLTRNPLQLVDLQVEVEQ